MTKISLLISLFSGRLKQFDLSLQSMVRQQKNKGLIELLVFIDYVDNRGVIDVLKQYPVFFRSVKAYLVAKKTYPVAHSASRRNFLALQATGEYIVFSEPEMFHIDNSIERLIKQANPQNIHNWICGPVFAAEDFVDQSGKMIVNEYRNIPHLDTLLGIVQRPDVLSSPAFLHNYHQIDYEFYKTPFFVVCFNRDTFLRLGGLNQNLKVRGFEETEFYQRFKRLGGKIIIDPKLVTIHLPHPRSLNQESQVCWDFYNSTVCFDRSQKLGELQDVVY